MFIMDLYYVLILLQLIEVYEDRCFKSLVSLVVVALLVDRSISGLSCSCISFTLTGTGCSLYSQLRPELEWHDIHGLFIETAQPVLGDTAGEWKQNGAGKWFSPLYGFGLLSASRMQAAVSTPAHTLLFTHLKENTMMASDVDGGKEGGKEITFTCVHCLYILAGVDMGGDEAAAVCFVYCRYWGRYHPRLP